MTQIETTREINSINLSSAIEEVIVKGDLAPLTPSQRVEYVTAVCRSIGLNPLTKPFDYIPLNGKLVLYARKDATDQLRKIYKISVTKVEEREVAGALVLITHVQDQFGRTDQARAAMVVSGLKGDALCNAIMKLETKSKRRATLSICGLGLLDESELETIEESRSGSKATAADPVMKASKWERREESQEPEPELEPQPETFDLENEVAETFDAEPLTYDQLMQTWAESNGFTMSQINAAVKMITKGTEWRALSEDRKAKALSDEMLKKIKTKIISG